jgi:hypothetical protein
MPPGSIKRYQKEAYWALAKIARQHGGAFLRRRWPRQAFVV